MDGDEGFALDQFYDRVARLAAIDYPEAVYRAQAVMSVLEEAVSPGEWADMCAQLPGEFDDLFSYEHEEEEIR